MEGMAQTEDARSEPTTKPRFESIEVHRLTEGIGAVVSGVRISGELTPTVVDEVRAALLANRVIFLRGQEHADDEDQRAFAGLFGTVTKPHPTLPGEGATILAVNSEYAKANSWHTDVTFVDRPPAISMVRAIQLPPYGGTTVWANTVAAYQRLHPGLQALAGSLRAVHSNLYDYEALSTYRAAPVREGGAEDENDQAFRRLEFVTEHPVVRVHPETGEPSLLLGRFVGSFRGLNTTDFHQLFGLFQRHITHLENTVRWTWQPGDVAVWDNRATQHFALADYGDALRLMHRITLAGEVPVGVNGDRSVALKGDSSDYVSAAAS